MENEGDPMRFMVPSLYTTDWFQTMFVGGNYPAPSSLAPRIMDNILLDGNIAVVFSLGLALMHKHKKDLLKLVLPLYAPRTSPSIPPLHPWVHR